MFKIFPTPTMTLSSVSGARSGRTVLLAMAVLSALSMALSAAAQETFVIHGTVNLSVNNADNFGIVSGDNFSGLLTYNPSGPGVLIQGSGGPARDSIGSSTQPFLSFSVDGRQFNLLANYLYVNHGNGPDQISTVWPSHEQNVQVNSPWGSFSTSSPLGLNTGLFMLSAQSGAALSSEALPTQYDISQWDNHYVNLGSTWVTDGTTHSFFMTADITGIDSISAVPEPSTISLFAAAGGLFVFRRYRRSRRTD